MAAQTAAQLDKRKVVLTVVLRVEIVVVLRGVKMAGSMVLKRAASMVVMKV